MTDTLDCITDLFYLSIRGRQVTETPWRPHCLGSATPCHLSSSAPIGALSALGLERNGCLATIEAQRQVSLISVCSARPWRFPRDYQENLVREVGMKHKESPTSNPSPNT